MDPFLAPRPSGKAHTGERSCWRETAASSPATLECGLLARRRFRSRASARMAVSSYVEGFYDPLRQHSALGYRSPVTYEREHATAAATTP